MNDGAYSIPQLVKDLRAIQAQAKDEHEVIKLVRPLARRAALAKDS